MRHPLVYSLFCGALGSLIGACGSTPTPGSAESPLPPADPARDEAAPGGEGEAPPSPSAVLRYELHEWGLVDVAREGSAELAAGPGQAALAAAQAPPQPTPQHPPVVRPGPATARKPVLYFHLLEGEGRVDVGATMTYGAMLERFPQTPMSGASLRWSGVEIVGRPCGVTAYPTSHSPECMGIPDGYCESAELAAYEARDVSCLVVEGRDYNHLFYRGGGTGLTLPITVATSAGATSITNASAHEIPLALYIAAPTETSRARRATAPVTVRRFGRVPAGTRADVRDAIPVDEAIAMTRAELGRLGLSEGETQAFMNAWEQAVFRQPSVREAVVYLLPPPLVDSVSTLALSPAPEVTRRAMMVRVEL